MVRLATDDEKNRDSWIEHLHIASYECMKMQLQSLREQLKERTGRDPIDNPEPTELPENSGPGAALNIYTKYRCCIYIVRNV